MLLPLILVVMSTILSLAYKYLKNGTISAAHLTRTTTVHAFAIEALQLTLAIVGSIVSCAILLLSPTLLYQFKIANFELYISTWLAASGTLAIYTSAIFAIDAIDSLIQLRSCRHPVQLQTFLLTRSVLMPSTVVMRRCTGEDESPRGRSRTPKALTASGRAPDGPATPSRLRDMGVQFPSETRNALVKGRPTYSRTFSTPSIVRGIPLAGSPFSSRSPVSKKKSLEQPDSALRPQNKGPVGKLGKYCSPGGTSKTLSPVSTKRSHSASLPLGVLSSIGSIDVEKMSASWDNAAFDFDNGGDGRRALAWSPRSFVSSTVSSSLEVRSRPRESQMERNDRVRESGGSLSSMGRARGSMVEEAKKRFEQMV